MSHGAAALTPDSSDVPNLGRHLADRLVEIGCHTAFAVPGDFNLLLLDQMLTKPELNLAWTCNELNAGYAADGFARKNGVYPIVSDSRSSRLSRFEELSIVP